MHTNIDPDVRRHLELRNRIYAELDRLITDWQSQQSNIPPRVVLAALIDAARRLHLRLEGDPIARPSRRGRVAP